MLNEIFNYRISALLLSFAAICAAIPIYSVPKYEHYWAGPKPIVVLLEGDGLPKFVLYEDGTVIFGQRPNTSKQLRYKKLMPTEFADVKQHLQPTLNSSDLRRSYNLAPSATDQMTTSIYLNINDRTCIVSLYGDPTGKIYAPTTTRRNPKATDVLPSEVAELHKYLLAYRPKKSRVWAPKYIEVELARYEDAPYASIVWPRKWPDLTSDCAFDHRAKKMAIQYSIIMNGDQIEPLEKFLSKRKVMGAVEMNGKKWSVYYRPIVPSEPIWQSNIWPKE
jgi:hypothetical protein